MIFQAVIISVQDTFGLCFCRRCILPRMFLIKTFLPVVSADESSFRLHQGQRGNSLNFLLFHGVCRVLVIVQYCTGYFVHCQRIPVHQLVSKKFTIPIVVHMPLLYHGNKTIKRREQVLTMEKKMQEETVFAAAGMLHENFQFRNILPSEGETAAEVERICFPPHEACSRNMMLERVEKAPELFLVAIDKRTGKMAGFLNGLSTEETSFRDEFFTDASLHRPEGRNIMLLGLDVLPEYRGQGLAREIVRQYMQRERENGRQSAVLTCLEEKVGMYQKMGFCDCGIADSSWGGEQWHEMRYAIHI